MNTTAPLVLVTGGSGFIAGHCILRLIEQGYRVRATVRSLDREPAVRAQLARTSGSTDSAIDVELTFVAADLTADDGWAEAMAGCDYVLHVASPLPHGTPDHEDQLIGPAREGTLRVLRAARDAGVKRLVLTSAFHAIGFGWGRTDHTFTEADWSKLDGPGIDAYGKSKTLAERAAWDFLAGEGGGLELVVVNPVAVLGPKMGPDVSGANQLVQRILTGAMPGYPDLWIPIVDVRDVAVAEVLALTTPDAAGERFLLGSGSGLTLRQIGAILRDELGDRAGQVPTRSIPSFVVRLAARFNPEMRSIVADLGVVKKINTEKARRVLGWTPREPRGTVVETARSLLGPSSA